MPNGSIYGWNIISSRSWRPTQSSLWIMPPFIKRTKETRALIQQAGHTLLFLPPDSPDFNPIEQDFATIKKRRQYAPPGTPLDDIIQSYGNLFGMTIRVGGSMVCAPPT